MAYWGQALVLSPNINALMEPNEEPQALELVQKAVSLKYWQGDGTPHDGIAEIVALTEQVIARNPRHPGAVHMYIHLMESVAPEKAEKAADTLLTLMPAAGEDLRRNQEDGWALFGLAQALRAQGKTANAELAEARLAKVWARADVKLTASRFGRPPTPRPQGSAPRAQTREPCRELKTRD